MIELKQIRKAFNQGRLNEFWALNGIDLSIDAKKVTGKDVIDFVRFPNWWPRVRCSTTSSPNRCWPSRKVDGMQLRDKVAFVTGAGH